MLIDSFFVITIVKCHDYNIRGTHSYNYTTVVAKIHFILENIFPKKPQKNKDPSFCTFQCAHPFFLCTFLKFCSIFQDFLGFSGIFQEISRISQNYITFLEDCFTSFQNFRGFSKMFQHFLGFSSRQTLGFSRSFQIFLGVSRILQNFQEFYRIF